MKLPAFSIQNLWPINNTGYILTFATDGNAASRQEIETGYEILNSLIIK